MYICPQCHTEFSSEQTFCTNCGAKMSQQSDQPFQQASDAYTQSMPPSAPEGGYYQQPQAQPYSYPSPAYPSYAPPKKRNTLLFAIVIAVVVILLVVVVILLVRNSKIKGQTDSLAQTATALQAAIENGGHVLEVPSTPEPFIGSPSDQNADIAAQQTASAIAQEEADAQAALTQEALNAEQTAMAQAADEEVILEHIPEKIRYLLDGATKVETETYQEETYYTDEWLETVLVAENIKNFVLTATFDNPYYIRTNDYWEMGILFRSKAANDQLRLFVTVPNYWELSYVGGEGSYWSTVKGWRSTIQALDRSEGGSNTITLVSDGQYGSFYINGVFISDLDLSSRPNYGTLSLWIDYNTKTRDGEKIIFRDIHLWNLD